VPEQRLLREVCEGDAPGLRPLPGDVTRLLAAVEVPPRLVAHLRDVHDVACDLLERYEASWPGLIGSPYTVAFGAAVHDIGKALHPQELSGPGSLHEQAGYRLLRDHGVDHERARFAATHAAWNEPHVTADDLAVSLADKVWRGHRVSDLEDRFLDAVSALGALARWESFVQLDDILALLAEHAEERLAFQNGYPTTSCRWYVRMLPWL
jgi:hypothetical protein